MKLCKGALSCNFSHYKKQKGKPKRFTFYLFGNQKGTKHTVLGLLLNNCSPILLNIYREEVDVNIQQYLLSLR